MSRPGFVLEVDDRTPPLLVSEGSGWRLQRFPLGTRVAYPTESLPSIADLAAGIDEALAVPLGSAPLSERLRPGMALTVTFTAGAAPASRNPDVRGLIIERVLGLAADAGVDDVVLIAANGLAARPTRRQLTAMLGERVVRSFDADGRLRTHDAEGACRRVLDGPDGEPIEVAERLLDSDLIVHVAVVEDARRSGAQQLLGLASAATLRRLGGAAAEPGLAQGCAAALAEALPVFAVEAVRDQSCYPPRLAWAERREWEWTLRDKAGFFGLRRLQSVADERANRVLVDQPAERALVGITAGAVASVAPQTAQLIARQQTVPMEPSDVVIAGVPAHTLHNPEGEVDPLTAAWSGLVDTLGAHTGTSALRPGGVLIVCHPLGARFSARSHPASADFFADVLTQTHDPVEIAERYEDRFAGDEWYRTLYQNQHAFHGLQPVQLWYEICAARAGVGEVIFVGADRANAERMGFRAASTLADALEIASSLVGRTPSIGYLHTPPRLIAEVS